LDQELRDRLLAIADAKAQSQGIDGAHEFIDKACTVFEKLALAFAPMRTRDGLVMALDRVEMSGEDKRWAIPMLEHFGHFLREALTALFETGMKDLPPVPSGRRRLLTPELASQINAYVLNLFGKNVELTVCKERAAQKFGVSYTTVQRAWRNRGEAQTENTDVGEFIKYVRNKLAEDWLLPEQSIGQIIKAEYRALAGTVSETNELSRVEHPPSS